MADSWVDSIGRIDQHPESEEVLSSVARFCGSPGHRARSRELLSVLSLSPGARMLEVGCGPGDILRDLAVSSNGPLRVVGADSSRRALELARHGMPAREGNEQTVTQCYVQMDGHTLAFRDAVFDAAFCSRTLVHVADPDLVITEMVRVVRPGGRVLCIEPAAQFSPGVDDALRVNVQAFSHPLYGRELLGAMRRAGLVDLTVTPHVDITTEPPDVDAFRAEFREGHGMRAIAVRDGRCTVADVELLFDQMEAAVSAGSWLDCVVHFGVMGTRP